MSAWMLEALIASSLLMLFVLIIRKPVAAQFGPRVGYWLWLLPALRMVLPPLPDHWFTAPMERLPDAIPIFVMDVHAAAAPIAADATINWGPLLVGVWVAGAVLHFVLHLWAYRQFARRAIANARFVREVDPGAIQVLATEEVTGPLAMGFAQQSILVPADFEWRYDAEEREFAIAHEVAHHQRGDLKVNFIGLALLSLHWFNPLAHMAYRAFRTDQELACDATIMADANADDRHAYGRALVKSACDRAPLATCALNRKQELKRRLRMMRFGQLSTARTVLARGLGLTVLGGGLILTASVGATAAVDTDVGRIVQGVMDDGSVAALAAASAQGPEELIANAHKIRADTNAKVAAAEAVADQAEATAAKIEAQRHEKTARKTLTQSQRDAIEAECDAAREHANAARDDANDARMAALEAQREARQAAVEARQEALETLREARQEAIEEAREARQEAIEAAHEAAVEARAAAAEARAVARRSVRYSWGARGMPAPPVAPSPPMAPSVAAPVPPVPPVAPVPPKVTISCQGHSSPCTNIRVKIDQKQLNRTVLTALKSARVQISSLAELSDQQKRAALRSLDAQIAELEPRSTT
jgi:bla regulator protein blaR1